MRRHSVALAAIPLLLLSVSLPAWLLPNPHPVAKRRFAQIELGMTMDQVHRAIGPPDFLRMAQLRDSPEPAVETDVSYYRRECIGTGKCYTTKLDIWGCGDNTADVKLYYDM